MSTENPLDRQVAGGHYKDLKIQPVEYIHANNIPFIEGCAIKYLTRWRQKGGLQDLEKAKHFIEMLIELEKKVKPANTVCASVAPVTIAGGATAAGKLEGVRTWPAFPVGTFPFDAHQTPPGFPEAREPK